jgi:hypothetical protein
LTLSVAERHPLISKRSDPAMFNLARMTCSNPSPRKLSSLGLPLRPLYQRDCLLEFFAQRP